MKIVPYRPREWGWPWILAGILWPVAGRLLNGTWPPPEIFLEAIIVILFGVLAAPALKRIIKDGLK